MLGVSWLISPESALYWYWARNIVGAVVATAVVGESIAHVSTRWLPIWLRSPEAIHKIAFWSWVILVAALALEIPIDMARDAIANDAISALEGKLAHATKAERVFTDEVEAQKLVAMLRPLSGSEFSILVDSADRNVNSEQARFGAQLRVILLDAGWTQSTNPMLQRVWAPNSNRGVLIGYRSDSHLSQTRFAALVAALNAFDIQTTADPFSDLDEHTFTFEIGIR
jgi:hypothetical protein